MPILPPPRVVVAPGIFRGEAGEVDGELREWVL